MSPRLRRARRLHEGGEFDAAERLYAEILRRDPQHFDALHLSGLLYYQRGRLDGAEKLLRAALAVDGGRADAHTDLGLVLLAAGRNEEARASYEAAISLAPADADARNGCGVALLRLSRPLEALASFEAALALIPGHVDALGNRGNALLKLNRPQEAIVSFDKGLAIVPTHARLLTNRAVALRRLDRAHEALMSVSRARASNPDFAEARFVESLIRLTLGDFAGGWREFESRWATTAFAPHRRVFTQPLWLGDRPLSEKTILIYAEQGYGDTIQFVRYVPAVAALGARVILEVQGELTRLLAACMQVEVIAHGQPLPRFDLHCPLMSLPLAFRTELATIPATTSYLAPPQQEAGLSRMIEPRSLPPIPPLKGEVDPPLARLRASSTRYGGSGGVSSGNRELLSFQRGEAPHPAPFGATLPEDGEGSGNAVPPNQKTHAITLREEGRAAPAFAGTWGSSRPLLIGLVWAGDPLHKNDVNRSIPLSLLRPLLDLQRLQFVSLQQEIAAHDAELLRSLPQLHLAGPFVDFAATAAVIAKLDAVIAVDTAVAHLAGAMGKPLFLLLPFGADFRWLRERPDSPWYPTARLFRQHAFADWGSAVDALREALMRFSANDDQRPAFANQRLA